ncbi:MAG: hypothetical protein RJA20_2546 [Bacteroidota bacterium]
MADSGIFQKLQQLFAGVPDDKHGVADLLRDISCYSPDSAPEGSESWKKIIGLPAGARSEIISQIIAISDKSPEMDLKWPGKLLCALLPGQSEKTWVAFIQQIQMMRNTDAQSELAFMLVSWMASEVPFVRQDLLTISLKHLFIKLKSRTGQTTDFRQKSLALLESVLASNPDGLYRELITKRFADDLGPVLSRMLRQDGANAGELLKLCVRYSDKSAPSPKWIREAETVTREMDRGLLAESAVMLFQKWSEIIRSEHKHPPEPGSAWSYKLEIPDWTTPFIWCAGLYLHDRPGIRQSLSELADLSYRKIPLWGSLAIKTGNACMHAFALIPDNSGIVYILRQQKKAVNKVIRSAIDKILGLLATRNNLTTGELMELAIPDFELDENGMRSFDFGDYEAILTIEGTSRVQIKWFQKKGEKLLKSAPAAVRKEFRDEYRALSAIQTEIKDALGGISKTLESAWLEKRSWIYIQLEKRLLDHPVLKFIAHRIIWRLESGSKTADAIFFDGNWQNPAGDDFGWITSDTTVTLWHPINVSADEVLSWRNWLEERQITQPFKQAYREVYVVTPPEVRTSSYSNRFAAHVLRQHQFAALCSLRGWNYKLQGDFYNLVTPHKDVPVWDYRIEFWTETNDLDDTLDSGIYQYIYTDQVRFSHQGRQVNMPDVPPIVFSELMRDVDLFVGVCSIGNDPDWQDSGNQRLRDYWRGYAFAEELSASGEVRLEALKKMIPRLKIAPKCRFDGRYLLVQGSRHLYKIHCGSGNILMSPNDKYLCIVPDQTARKNKEQIYLPFEGDTLLSIIISKAMLLANDNEITDPTILIQL